MGNLPPPPYKLMAFKFSISSQSQVLSQERNFLLDEVAELCDAKCELEVHLGKLDSIEGVIDNISTSLKALDTIEDSGAVIKVLNMDQSIENLLGVAEDSISKKIATEGLGDALKRAWEAFKKWCKDFWERIKDFFKKVFNFLTGRDREDDKRKLDLEKIFKETNDQLVAADKQISELKKKLTDVSKQTSEPKLKQVVEKTLVTAAKDIDESNKQFAKVLKDNRATKAQIAESTAKVHEAVTKYKDSRSQLASELEATMQFVKDKEKAKEEKKKILESVKPAPQTSTPPPPPTPPEPKPYEGPSADSCRQALAAFKQLANAFLPAWNAQAGGVKKDYDNFVSGDLNAESADKANKLIVDAVNTAIAVANAALNKIDEHIHPREQDQPMAWKVHDDNHDKKWGYKKFMNVTELGFKDNAEASQVCTELRKVCSGIGREVGKVADNWYLDMMSIEDRFDADSKLTPEQKQTLSKAMSVYRNGMLMERLAVMICQFASTYNSGGTSEILACVKGEASFATQCARSVSKSVSAQL